jgi:hypothetical protein
MGKMKKEKKKIAAGEAHIWCDPFTGRYYEDTASGTYPLVFGPTFQRFLYLVFGIKEI